VPDAATVRVGFVGLSCRDHVWQVERFPPVASRTRVSAYRAHGGGPAATAACAAARLGAEAHLWAVHGDDEAGAACAAELERAGVVLAGVRQASGADSFVAGVLVTPSGERFIFPYQGRELPDDPDGHDWSALANLDAIVTDARHPRLAEHALAAARHHGIVTVGDWGDRRHWSLTAMIDHLVVSEECAQLALGSSPDDGALDIRTAAAALHRLRAAAGQLVAVTLGDRGVVWDAGAGPRRLAAPLVEPLVDTTGAGDAFHGAYAVALASGRAVHEAMRLASAVAALKCRGHGRSTLPARDEAERVAAALPPEEIL
jgi:sulfofructose kinase